uniref:mitogen-activated protein kinase kinase n=1 Tax=Felis catus TaxID=9685 RepID=A0ABI8A348_FELCA
VAPRSSPQVSVEGWGVGRSLTGAPDGTTARASVPSGSALPEAGQEARPRGSCSARPGLISASVVSNKGARKLLGVAGLCGSDESSASANLPGAPALVTLLQSALGPASRPAAPGQPGRLPPGPGTRALGGSAAPQLARLGVRLRSARARARARGEACPGAGRRRGGGRGRGGRWPRPSAVREAELAALQPPRRRSAPHSQQWRLRARAAAAAAPGAAAAAAPRAPWGPRRRATRPSAACRRIRSTVDEKEQKQLLMDLDVVMRSSDCPYIVQFYGALFREGDCWICMELMSTSFDKFYKYVYSVLDDVIPEEILGKITLATVKALNHLKENLKIIHRDIKPSNILLDRSGNIKLCDFGISGQLVDSIAKTRDAGCRPYMAPERIDPSASRQGYDVRSDVWSLGITLYELATGRFPYPKWNSVFDQLTQVVKGDPPQLSNSEEREFSPSFINFVNLCLTKDESKRPKYKELLKHPFILMYEERTVEVACYVCKILDQMPATPSSPMYVD